MCACAVLSEYFRLFAWAHRRRRLSTTMRMSSAIRRADAVGSFDCGPSRAAEPTAIPTKIEALADAREDAQARIYVRLKDGPLPFRYLISALAIRGPDTDRIKKKAFGRPSTAH